MTSIVRTFGALAAALVLAGTSEAGQTSWLDAKPLAAWNRPGAPVPAAPKSDTTAADFERCSGALRHETFPEDREVRAAGWQLFEPLRLFNGTVIVGGLSGFDGMCRPNGYQEFVFVGGKFAGTLAPTPMNSRTDGALDAVYLSGATQLAAGFRRYAQSDPLCCPSRTSFVTYAFDRGTKNGPSISVTDVSTSPNQGR